jgi:DNA polymerase-3 subunit alpha
LEEWNFDYKLQCERAVLGFYASGSPLDKYKYEIDGISTLKLGLEKGENDENGFEDNENSFSNGVKFSNLMKLHETTQSIAGIITDRKVLSSKKDGRSFAFLTLEDIYGIKSEIALWADKYSAYSEFTQKDKIIVVKGRTSVEIGENEKESESAENGVSVKITADKIIPIEDARSFLNKVHLELSLDKLKEENLDEIVKICANQKGDCSLTVHFVSESGSEFELKSQNVKVNNSYVFLDKLNAHSSVNSVWLSQ